jgi:hypothetical protein
MHVFQSINCVASSLYDIKFIPSACSTLAHNEAARPGRKIKLIYYSRAAGVMLLNFMTFRRLPARSRLSSRKRRGTLGSKYPLLSVTHTLSRANNAHIYDVDGTCGLHVKALQRFKQVHSEVQQTRGLLKVVSDAGACMRA